MRGPEYYSGREQTYVKHLFLERYLETLAYHICYSPVRPRFVYVDCFSGPWQARDEAYEDTSIHIALTKLTAVKKRVAELGKRVQIDAVFVEKRSASYRALEEAVQPHRDTIKISTIQGRFEERIPELLRLVKDAFAFFFIDPTGWTGFGSDRIGPLLRHDPGEVLINLMWKDINRFVGSPDEATQNSFDRLFGTRAWREIYRASTAQHREYDLTRFYCEQLKKVGRFRFATSARVLNPLAERTHFHLIYGTRHHKGITEFRRIERKVHSDESALRWDIREQRQEQKTGQLPMEFQSPGNDPLEKDSIRKRSLELVRGQMLTCLAGAPHKLSHLRAQVLQLPMIEKHDFDNLLAELCEQGEIELTGPLSKSGKPADGTLIMLA